MEEVWEKTRAVYQRVASEKIDPRTKDWPLVRSVWSPIIIAILYTLLCWNAKRLTSGFPTLSIRPIIVFYSFAMVLFNLYMTCEFFVTAYLSSYSLICQPVDYSTQPLAIRMANVLWLYYVSKFVDMVETSFYALRKKYNQISGLHVYHHASMVLLCWIILKYVPGGQSFTFAILNTFVHAVMYTYYGLSGLGPHMQRYLWWKKYITKLQLMQFFVMLVFLVNNTFLTQCDYPLWVSAISVTQVVIFIVLFLKFYFRAYSSKTKKVTEGETPVLNGTWKGSRVNGHNGAAHGLQKAKEQ